jgi:hypothetical protein
MNFIYKYPICISKKQRYIFFFNYELLVHDKKYFILKKNDY